MEEYDEAFDCEIRRRPNALLMDGPWSCVPEAFDAEPAEEEED